MQERKSIILITVDSLRADRVGASLTPNIERWAGKATRLTGAVANGPHTGASFPSILASSYLSRGGFSESTPSLAETLKARGYRTAAFVAANPYISRLGGYARGFETFVDWMEVGRGDVAKKFKGIAGTGGILRRWLGPRRLPVMQFVNGLLGRRQRPFPPGQAVAEEALKWLGSGRGPVFLWIHLMDLHYPYLSKDRPAEVSRIEFASGLGRALLGGPGGGADLMRRLYDFRVRDVDAVTARLLDGIAGWSGGSNAVIAFTADHGEQFAERGSYAHPSSLFEEQLRVPLVIGEAGADASVLPGQFPLIDLSPTLLGLVGLDPPAAWQGADQSRPILGRASGDFVFHAISEAPHIGGGQIPMAFPGVEPRESERIFWTFSVRSRKWKYIFDDEGQKELLFDLEKDPGELDDRARGEAEVIHRLRELLRVHRSGSLAPSGSADRRLSAGEEELVKKQLKDLGYL